MTRMEQQEPQQSTASVDEFNEVKNVHINLTHLMTMMFRWFDNQVLPSTTQDSGSPPIIPSQEAPISQNQHMPAASIQINEPQPLPQYDHHEIPQYEEEISTGSNRETNDKVDELERQLK